MGMSNLKLQYICSINSNFETIYCISIFPSGNIISISDNSIKIYSPSFKIIQNIPNAFVKGRYVSIKDEKNFVTCSWKNIEIWIKKENENKFSLKNIIKNAHKIMISKIIYCSNGNIISCSYDKTIKIWEEILNNEYQSITILTHLNAVCSIMLLEDKNYLVSSGEDGNYLWNFNNFENKFSFFGTLGQYSNQLQRFDDNKFITGGINNNFIIVKINYIVYFENIYEFSSSYVIEDKGIFLISSYNMIKVYNINDYNCIQDIKYAHNGKIYGFVQLRKGIIASYGEDNIINIWYVNS